MDSKTIKRLRDLPDPLNPKDIQSFLGLSKNSTYNLLDTGLFHSIKVGKLYKIPKSSFAKWYLGG